MRIAVCLSSVVLSLLVFAGPAAASERLSVFMVADDAALADNLVEVSIARLSGARDWELVGMRELEGALQRIPEVRNGDLRSCLDAPECLSALGERAGTRRSVVGKVERKGESYALELSLVDTKTRTTERRTARADAADLDALIAAVKHGVAELFGLDEGAPDEAVAPMAPLASTPASLGLVAPARDASPAPLTVPRPADRTSSQPGRGSVAPYVGFAATGLAIVAFSTAAIAGSVARSPPSGDTRKLRQDDLERREDYAVAANVALAAGGVFSAVAVVAFVWQ